MMMTDEINQTWKRKKNEDNRQKKQVPVGKYCLQK